jgi:hypothetical protein
MMTHSPKTFFKKKIGKHERNDIANQSEVA